VDAKGTEYWVDGTIGAELTTDDDKPANYWNFVVPQDVNKYQDGNWTLTDVKMWDVFAADGSAYTEETPLTFDLSNTDNKTKVVSRVYVSFPADQSKDFGKDAAGNITGTLLQSHTISGLSVDFKDFENKGVSGVTDVQLQFAYTNGSSTEYGGYSSNDLTNATDGATVTVTLTDPDGDGHFVQTADTALLFAGKYITQFSYKVNGTLTTTGGTSGNALPSGAPAFTVWSQKPTLSIDSTNPANGESYDTMNADANSMRVTASVNERTITIFPEAKVTTGCNAEVQIIRQAKVALKLAGLGNATRATLEFTNKDGDPVYMYPTNADGSKNDNQTSNYEWTSGTSVITRIIGNYMSTGCSGMSAIKNAGTIESDTYVTIEWTSGATTINFTVVVDPITIIQE
jgi:hypothetical protein